MIKGASIERQLLMASNAGDMSSIVNIVGGLSVEEKESVGTNVFDTVLGSIVRYGELDRAESAYTMLMFIRSVGHYTSQAAISATLHAMPASPPRCAVERLERPPSHTMGRVIKMHSVQ